MENETPSFRVDLRLLLELGERLISRDEIAIVELVKNAYDADADSIDVNISDQSIEIRDTGEGMDKEGIIQGWLTIGSTLKIQKNKTAKGRRVLGEKGLGRLAILRLGKKITIFTQKENQPCYKIIIDWVNTRNKLLHSKKYTPLGDFSLDITEVEKSPIPEKHGTFIIIENLNNSWDEKGKIRLQTFFSRLLEEYDRDFPDAINKVNLDFTFKGEKINLEPPKITQNPHYNLEISIDNTGNYHGTLKWNIEKSRDFEKIIGNIPHFKRIAGKNEKRWDDDPEVGCGPFTFKLSVWDLDAKELKYSKKDLKDWAGVSLVKDSIRVIQPDVDWLGLDLRRVQNPTMRLSTNQVIGSVIVTSDNNPALIEKTDREGLLDVDSSQLLKTAVFTFFDIVERKRYRLRHDKTLSKGFVLSPLDTSPLKQFSKDIPKEKMEQFEDFIDNLDNYREYLDEWALGRDRMATMGLLGARLVHEARNSLMMITDSYPLIRNAIPEMPSQVQEAVKRMVTAGQNISLIFNELDPFIKFRQKRPVEDIKFNTIVSSLEFLFKPDINRNKIRINNTIDKNIIFRANRTDIFIIFANLLDNSIFWIEQYKPDIRIIEFRAEIDENKLLVQVADSGPGIDIDDYDLIFDTGWTRKEEGTGLGLSIVKDMVESYHGKIRADKDEKLKGALFEIGFPFKKVS